MPTNEKNLTKVNPFEGVPLGSDVLKNYFKHIESSSVSTLEAFAPAGFPGGTSPSNPASSVARSAGGGFAITNTNTSVSSYIFGKVNKKLVQIDTPVYTGQDAYFEWQVKLSDAENINSVYAGTEPKLVFKNVMDVVASTGGVTIFTKKTLPLFVRYGTTGRGTAPNVYVNGVPQIALYTTPVSAADLNSKLELDFVVYGAESPHPINAAGNFVGDIVPSTSLNTGNFYFPYTQFGLQGQSHIVLRGVGAVVNEFYYLPEFIGSGTQTLNTYMVTNRSTGEIKLNVDINVILTYVYGNTTAPTIQIASLEQLSEVVSTTSINYKTLNGEIYNGDNNVSIVKLLELKYLGGNAVLTRISNTDISTTPNSATIYAAPTNSSLGRVILAYSYYGRPKIDLDAVSLKYRPPTLSIYTAVAVPNDASFDAATSSANVRMVIDENQRDYYNAETLNQNGARYQPVHRSTSGIPVLFGTTLAANFGSGSFSESFDPTFPIGLTSGSIGGVPASEFLRKFNTGTATAQTVNGLSGLTFTINTAFNLSGNFIVTGGISATTTLTSVGDITTSAQLNGANLKIGAGAGDVLRFSTTVIGAGVNSRDLLFDNLKTIESVLDTPGNSRGLKIGKGMFDDRVASSGSMFTELFGAVTVKNGTSAGAAVPGNLVVQGTGVGANRGKIFATDGTTNHEVYSPLNPPPAIAGRIPYTYVEYNTIASGSPNLIANQTVSSMFVTSGGGQLTQGWYMFSFSGFMMREIGEALPLQFALSFSGSSGGTVCGEYYITGGTSPYTVFSGGCKVFYQTSFGTVFNLNTSRTGVGDFDIVKSLVTFQFIPTVL